MFFVAFVTILKLLDYTPLQFKTIKLFFHCLYYIFFLLRILLFQILLNMLLLAKCSFLLNLFLFLILLVHHLYHLPLEHYCLVLSLYLLNQHHFCLLIFLLRLFLNQYYLHLFIHVNMISISTDSPGFKKCIF